LKAGSIGGAQLAPGSITGIQIDTATLGQVPTAVHADTADSARDAQTALNAVNAIDAIRVNGHTAGCKPPARFFAGACWQTGSSEAAVSAPAAALACSTQGGELPDALSLVAFSQQPGIALAAGDEWTGDLTNVSGPGIYAVVTVSAAGTVSPELSTAAKKYRCVVPLVSCPSPPYVSRASARARCLVRVGTRWHYPHPGCSGARIVPVFASRACSWRWSQ
jgi:hypothetical protein